MCFPGSKTILELNMIKIYALIWAIALSTLGILYITGALTRTIVVGFGFFFAVLTFMGFMSVLPSAVEREVHHH